MASLFEELLEIYCRFAQAENEDDDCWAANADARDELGKAIVRIAKPRTVGDVMALPHEYLRWDGLVYLIERDACDEYEDIDGYIQVVIMDDVDERITPEQHGFNGSQLCEWIDRTYPVTTESAV
jgi:hypothetical protein